MQCQEPIPGLYGFYSKKDMTSIFSEETENQTINNSSQLKFRLSETLVPIAEWSNARGTMCTWMGDFLMLASLSDCVQELSWGVSYARPTC